MCLRGLRGGDDLFIRRASTAHADILAHGVGEQEGVLTDIGHMRLKRGAADAAQIDAVKLHRAFGRIVEPQ